MENIKNKFEGRFKEGVILGDSQKLIFENLEGKRIYNPTAPFKIGNESYIVCRVEDRKTGISQSMLFTNKEGIWLLVKDAPVFELEDPFVSFLEDGILFGGVYVEWENRKVKFLRTIFYYAKNFFELDPQMPFAQGPLMMKDIRIVQLKDRIGIFTRPQGGKFLRGRIAYLEVYDLNDLKNENIYNRGNVIEVDLKDNEWVGSNEIHYLDNNHLGILAHLAFEDDYGDLHYSAITFVFDRIHLQAKNLTIIARRENFPEGPSKEKRLRDVVFPGGLVQSEDRNYILYCGLSDEEVGYVKIKNPFEL